MKANAEAPSFPVHMGSSAKNYVFGILKVAVITSLLGFCWPFSTRRTVYYLDEPGRFISLPQVCEVYLAAQV